MKAYSYSVPCRRKPFERLEKVVFYMVKIHSYSVVSHRKDGITAFLFCLDADHQRDIPPAVLDGIAQQVSDNTGNISLYVLYFFHFKTDIHPGIRRYIFPKIF